MSSIEIENNFNNTSKFTQNPTKHVRGFLYSLQDRKFSFLSAK